MRIKCDNCGAHKRKPANYLKLYKKHFCNKDCYHVYRRRYGIAHRGKKYDCSQQNILRDLVKEKDKLEFRSII